MEPRTFRSGVGADLKVRPSVWSIHETPMPDPLTPARDTSLRMGWRRELRARLAQMQLALSLTLLIGALLLVATLQNLRGVDVGFDAANMVVLRADLRENKYSDERSIAYQRDLLAALRGSFSGSATIGSARRSGPAGSLASCRRERSRVRLFE